MYEMFDGRLGDLKGAKNTGIKMELPKLTTETTAEEIMQPIHAYVHSRVTEYYVLIPYLEKMCVSYDQATGLYYKPLTRRLLRCQLSSDRDMRHRQRSSAKR